MYTGKELKVADTFSRGMYKVRTEMHKEAKNIVTRWGKNLIEFEGLEVRSYIHPHNKPTLVCEIGYPREFGAAMTMRYEEGEISYSKGTTGLISKETTPRQYDIYLILAKLIEHEEKLQEIINKYMLKYMVEIKKIEKEQNRIDTEYPGLRAAYFESAMYKERLSVREVK